jgi:hypothetical protein
MAEKIFIGNIKGKDAKITGVTATVDGSTGTPSVAVTLGGTESERSFHFDFSGLKGEKGETGEPGAEGKVTTIEINKLTPTYTEAESLTTLSSGEALSVAFGKIKKAISSLISHIADTTKHITSTERTTWNGKAPTSHASTATTYGVGTSSNYGHLKITDDVNSKASDVAASTKLVSSISQSASWTLLSQKTYNANFVAQMYEGQAFEITGVDFSTYEEIKLALNITVSLPANSTAARNCLISFGKTSSSSANAGSYVNVESFQQNQGASATTYNSSTILKLYAQKYGDNLMYANQYSGTPVSLIEKDGTLYLRIFMSGGTTTSTGNGTANVELSIYGKGVL